MVSGNQARNRKESAPPTLFGWFSILPPLHHSSSSYTIDIRYLAHPLAIRDGACVCLPFSNLRNLEFTHTLLLVLPTPLLSVSEFDVSMPPSPLPVYYLSSRQMNGRQDGNTWHHIIYRLKYPHMLFGASGAPLVVVQ